MAWNIYTASAGCLPDSEPVTTDTNEEATDAVREIVATIADDYMHHLGDDASAAVAANTWEAKTMDAVPRILARGGGSIPFPFGLYALTIDAVCDGSGTMSLVNAAVLF